MQEQVRIQKYHFIPYKQYEYLTKLKEEGGGNSPPPPCRRRENSPICDQRSGNPQFVLLISILYILVIISNLQPLYSLPDNPIIHFNLVLSILACSFSIFFLNILIKDHVSFEKELNRCHKLKFPYPYNFQTLII